MRRGVGAALFAVLVLASCSGGDDAPDTTVPAPDTTTAVDTTPATEPAPTTEPLIGAIDGPVSIDTAVRATEAP